MQNFFTLLEQLSVIVIQHMCVCFLSIAQCLHEQQMRVQCFLFFSLSRTTRSFFFILSRRCPHARWYIRSLCNDFTHRQNREREAKMNIYIYGERRIKKKKKEIYEGKMYRKVISFEGFFSLSLFFSPVFLCVRVLLRFFSSRRR